MNPGGPCPVLTPVVSCPTDAKPPGMGAWQLQPHGVRRVRERGGDRDGDRDGDEGEDEEEDGDGNGDRNSDRDEEGDEDGNGDEEEDGIGDKDEDEEGDEEEDGMGMGMRMGMGKQMRMGTSEISSWGHLEREWMGSGIKAHVQWDRKDVELLDRVQRIHLDDQRDGAALLGELGLFSLERRSFRVA
ncbi:hypothetical protein HGM15179_007582 [Zosterops borbonicus]|uniref:Uncharacterized protein n=1 Tax=Zosterops borbonicus TaxID=364589 RepID=A0A8K1GK94_9PASS|nr:hypothetical protein HGM15179_007582 [Zosterops borbonicus]